MNPMPRRLVIALGGFAVAALVFGYALFRAMTVEPANALPLPTPPAAADEQTPPPATPPRPDKKPKAGTTSADAQDAAPKSENIKLNDLMMAVDADPFRPDRQRVSDRYRMPGDELPVEEPPAPPPPPPPPFRIIGTLVTPTGGVAVVQHNETGARMVVGIGETGLQGMSGYKVDRVSANNATVSNAVQTVTLPVMAASTGRAGRGGRGTPAPNAQQQQQLQQNMQNLQRAMEQLRQMGNSPQVQQMMEALQRQMVEQRALQAGGRGGVMFEMPVPAPAGGRGNVAVPRDRVIIRPRVDTMATPAPARRPN